MGGACVRTNVRVQNVNIATGLHPMPHRAGSADLPLHGGQVPRWLSLRMSRLGAVMAEAIVHHNGRDEFIRRLANPFWFQSFGAVMGMDWHSSGITTSVIGALKRGLAPLAKELGVHVCGGRGKHSRDTPHELVAIGAATGVDGAALARASRLVAKIDSAAVQDGFNLYLHGFIVTDDGKWVVVQQGMNAARREARRYHWLSQGLTSFLDDPHAAIDGVAQGNIVNLADRRADSSRRAQLDLLSSLGPDKIAREFSLLEHAGEAAPDANGAQPLLPHLVMPAHHDVRASDVIARRLHGTLAAAAERGPQDFPDLLLTPGVGARTVAALAMVAEVVHGAPCRFARSRAVFLRARRQGPPPLPGADQGLRRDHPGAQIGGAQGEARARGGAGCTQAPRRSGARTRAPRARPLGRNVDRGGTRPLAVLRSSLGIRRTDVRCQTTENVI
jgi:uncharacterized protein